MKTLTILKKTDIIPAESDYKVYIVDLPGGGVKIADDTPFEAYEAAVRDKGRAHKYSLVDLGDLLNWASERFGETYAQALNSGDYSEKTIRNAMWLANAVPKEERRPELTYNILQLIAPIKDKAVRKELVKELIEDDLTVRELTERIHIRFPKKAKAAKTPAKSTEDEAGATETQKPVGITPKRELTALEGLQRLDEAAKWLGDLKVRYPSGIPVSLAGMIAVSLNAVRRNARKNGFLGGQATGAKK